jgi:hypothetical protein
MSIRQQLRSCYGIEQDLTGFLAQEAALDADSSRRNSMKAYLLTAICADEHGEHDILFGELLPDGVGRLLDREHLDIESASSLTDLGMGVGKLSLQAFLQYKNLQRVVAVECSSQRFRVATRALEKLAYHDAPNNSNILDLLNVVQRRPSEGVLGAFPHSRGMGTHRPRLGERTRVPPTKLV